jgi:hypothetical protein
LDYVPEQAHISSKDVVEENAVDMEPEGLLTGWAVLLCFLCCCSMLTLITQIYITYILSTWVKLCIAYNVSRTAFG